MTVFKEYITRNMRWLVWLRRYLIAIKDTLSDRKSSYAQHAEDTIFSELLKDLDLSNGIYVDVGANHPTLYSNTYLFYRTNNKGVLVEPDTSLCALLNKFRPRDIVIRSLVGADRKLVLFNNSYNSALSSVKSLAAKDIRTKEYIPQITLDDITETVKPKWIFLLSVDAEKADFSVIKGGEDTLNFTYLVCIENTGSDIDEIDGFLKSKSFELVKKISVNSIYRNTLILIPQE
jgi:FkbM family methyltransferase